MGNNFDRINKETQNIGSTAPKSNSNKSKIFKNSKTKITLKHPIYKSNEKSQDKTKKASDNKNTYSSVRIKTDTSTKLRALLKVTNYKNRDELINKMIHLSKPTLLNNSINRDKYEKAYKIYKIQRKQDEELDKL